MSIAPSISSHRYQGVIHRYSEHLPVSETTPVITLLEGNTPLVPVPGFVEAIGGKFDLYLKYEGLNPTCSFKDRGMTLAVSKAKERGAEVVICASTAGGKQLRQILRQPAVKCGGEEANQADHKEEIHPVAVETPEEDAANNQRSQAEPEICRPPADLPGSRPFEASGQIRQSYVVVKCHWMRSNH